MVRRFSMNTAAPSASSLQEMYGAVLLRNPKMADYPTGSPERVKNLLKHESTNHLLTDLQTHIRYMNYTDKEFETKGCYRLPKIYWIAEGMPSEPILKKD